MTKQDNLDQRIHVKMWMSRLEASVLMRCLEHCDKHEVIAGTRYHGINDDLTEDEVLQARHDVYTNLAVAVDEAKGWKGLVETHPEDGDAHPYSEVCGVCTRMLVYSKILGCYVCPNEKDREERKQTISSPSPDPNPTPANDAPDAPRASSGCSPR